MKYFILMTVSILSFSLFSFEYELNFENDLVSVAKVKIFPFEEIDLHRDVYPQVVVGIKGGTITRLEADGREVDVIFPTGVAVFREIDPANELHRSVNRSNEEIELMIIQLKS